jgi:hypothetical protein
LGRGYDDLERTLQLTFDGSGSGYFAVSDCHFVQGLLRDDNNVTATAKYVRIVPSDFYAIRVLLLLLSNHKISERKMNLFKDNQTNYESIMIHVFFIYLTHVNNYSILEEFDHLLI